MKIPFTKFLCLLAVSLIVISLLCSETPAWAAPYTVINTNDSGPGSLRQAIIDANAHAGEDIISFNIPKTDPGYSPSTTGGWIIQPASLLPSLTGNNTIIDGATQTTNQGDTNPLGPEITVNGLFLPVNSWVFSVESNANQILGLAICGASESGVQLKKGASGNIIKDNYIGIAANLSTGPWANHYGVRLHDSANGNVIAHNTISGNVSHGILISDSNTDGNMMPRNTIGLDPTGTILKPNGGKGIYFLSGPKDNIVGGEEGYRNIISGNSQDGVYISTAHSNQITYNNIGLDESETKDMGNNGSGVFIINASTSNNVSNNLISGNADYGIYLSGSGTDYNIVRSNIIGWNKQLDESFPNDKHGVGIYNGAQHNEIGNENNPNDYNTIIASKWSGVAIVNAGSDHNTIANNVIVGNFYYGVGIVEAADNDILYNEIWYNGVIEMAGVVVDGVNAVHNKIRQNSIYDNNGLGIKLINGGNSNQIAPTISQASCRQVSGTACAGCTVEIFSGEDDEGRYFEGAVTADPVTAVFSWSGLLHGPFVTTTASDAQGNTSQFSAPFSIGACPRIFLPLVVSND